MRPILERASARQTAVVVAAGAVAKALLRELGVEVAGIVVDLDELAGRVDAAREDRDTVGGIVEVRANGVPRASARMRPATDGSTPGSPVR